MPKDLVPHELLITQALPQAIGVLTETMMLEPWKISLDPESGEEIKEFNTRINGQRLRAALGTVSLVERLGDQALRRQAGGQLKTILQEIKKLRPDLAPTIDHDDA